MLCTHLMCLRMMSRLCCITNSTAEVWVRGYTKRGDCVKVWYMSKVP